MALLGYFWAEIDGENKLADLITYNLKPAE